MVFVREGDTVPEGTQFLIEVSEREIEFLEQMPKRKRFHWLKRLRRRSGRELNIITPDAW